MEQCAKDIKKVSLELGGNAPFIVFDDADLDKAVEGALASKFRNAGQTCVCANRLYVRTALRSFAEKLNQAVNKLAVGDGLQADVAIGPLIDEKAVAKVQEHIADALEKGARVITGGEAHKLGGNFFNRPFWRMSLITRKSPKKRHSGHSRLCSASATRRMSSGRLTIPSSAWQPIFMLAI